MLNVTSGGEQGVLWGKVHGFECERRKTDLLRKRDEKNASVTQTHSKGEWTGCCDGPQVNPQANLRRHVTGTSGTESKGSEHRFTESE